MAYLQFLAAYLLTVLIEGAAIFVWYRRRDYLYYSFLCNTLTNPALNLVLMLASILLGYNWYWYLLAPLELCVVAVEAVVYRKLCRFSWMRAITTSLILNVLSWALGMWLNTIW